MTNGRGSAETRLPSRKRGGKRAELDGPQDITVHGRSVAVVLSRAPFERLSGQSASLVNFMQASPLAGLDDKPAFERDTSPTHDIAL